jgi:hypothetical protein
MVARFFARANRPARANQFLAAFDRFLPEALEERTVVSCARPAHS